MPRIAGSMETPRENYKNDTVTGNKHTVQRTGRTFSKNPTGIEKKMKEIKHSFSETFRPAVRTLKHLTGKVKQFVFVDSDAAKLAPSMNNIDSKESFLEELRQFRAEKYDQAYQEYEANKKSLTEAERQEWIDWLEAGLAKDWHTLLITRQEEVSPEQWRLYREEMRSYKEERIQNEEKRLNEEYAQFLIHVTEKESPEGVQLSKELKKLNDQWEGLKKHVEELQNEGLATTKDELESKRQEWNRVDFLYYETEQRFLELQKEVCTEERLQKPEWNETYESLNTRWENLQRAQEALEKSLSDWEEKQQGSESTLFNNPKTVECANTATSTNQLSSTLLHPSFAENTADTYLQQALADYHRDYEEYDQSDAKYSAAVHAYEKKHDSYIQSGERYQAAKEQQPADQLKAWETALDAAYNELEKEKQSLDEWKLRLDAWDQRLVEKWNAIEENTS